jgi:hypothetical protein
MIKIEVEKEELSNIEKRLENMSKESSNVLKKALNETGRQAKKDLLKATKMRYALTGGAGELNKSVNTKSATKSNLVYTIESKGGVREISDFKASPFEVKNGLNRNKIIKAKVLKTSGMKGLQKGNIKAFVAQFKSGHKAVVERNPDKKMKSNPQKEALRKILSPSVPSMLSTTYGETEQGIYNILKENISKHIQTVLGGKS